MIEITAKLVRADCAGYATGEKIECVIEFVHKGGASDDESRYVIYILLIGKLIIYFIVLYCRDKFDNLAWASVQLHCYCKTSNSDKSATPTVNDLADSLGKTALDSVIQSPGNIILSTEPKILFCDLKLGPTESKQCEYINV